MASTRKRTTTKTGNFTKRTVTISDKGTRVTNSFRPPGGATRRTHSVNLRTAQNRITHTTHRGTKKGSFSITRSNTKTLVRKGSLKKSSGDGGLIVLLIGAFFVWLFNLIFEGKKEPEEKELSDNEKVLLSHLEHLTDNQTRILIYDTLGMWVDATSLTEEQKEKIREFDWINFDFENWKIENGFEEPKGF
jgi:hypothetical protein